LPNPTGLIRINVRGKSKCCLCGQDIPPNGVALWDKKAHTVRHEPECDHTPVYIKLECGHWTMMPYKPPAMLKTKLCPECGLFKKISDILTDDTHYRIQRGKAVPKV